MMTTIRDRGSTLVVATLIAMFMIFIPSANATASPTTNDDFTAISAVDLTNDITISSATMATPRAICYDGPASTEATRATLDDYDMTRPTASPPKAISMNESAYDCDIGTATATTLSTDDMNRATYCNSGVHRLLTRTPATNTTLVT